MNSLPITSAITSDTPAIKDNNPRFLFTCEKDCTIPFMTYDIQDNHVQITMRCDTVNSHVETINYNEYRNLNAIRSGSDDPGGKNKCENHSKEDSVGYCRQHKINFCNSCKLPHMRDFPGDLILQNNFRIPNLNAQCKEHPNNSKVFYCEQCKLRLCVECATNKHKYHPALNMKQLTSSLELITLKEDVNTFEENYFNAIDTAYAQAQEEWRKDYENNKSVNRELFDVIRSVLHTADVCKESNDYNLFRNVSNIAKNLNTRHCFQYQPGKIQELQNYWKRNLVLNINNIKDANLTSVTDLSNTPADYSECSYTTRVISKVDMNTPATTTPATATTTPAATTIQQEINCVRNEKEFECITTATYDDQVYSLCKLNDALYAVGAGSLYTEGKIYIVEYPNSSILRSLTGHSKCIWRWYWHKKTNYLLSSSFDSDIRIWNYSDGTCIAVLKGHGGIVKDITELAKGDIITVSENRSIKYWNMNTFKCYKNIKDAHSHWITSVLISCDKLWITGGWDKLWKVWKVNANKKDDVSNMITTDSEIWSWLEVKDRWLVGLYSRDIWVYNLNGFTQVGKLQRHTRQINIMVRWADGSFVSGGNDSRLIVWDVHTLSCLQVLEGHASYVQTGWIEMSANEIMSGSLDKTVKTWRRK